MYCFAWEGEGSSNYGTIFGIVMQIIFEVHYIFFNGLYFLEPF